MRVLAINQFYAPDMAATSQLLTQLCEDLHAAGDEVTVIAGRGGYLGEQPLPAREVIGGVQVLRPWATHFGKGSIPGRLSDYLSFWASAVARAVTVARPEVLLALTTPPMIAAGAALVAQARRIPLVTWVQDVYPEAAVAFDVLAPGHPLVTGLSLLNRATHRFSAATAVLADDMAERVLRQGQRRDKLHVIPNWSDGRVVRPLAHADNPFRASQGLQDRFVVMYSGNLGVGHDVVTLVEAARLLARSRPQVLLLFIGQGARRAEAEQAAQGLGNVRFLPYQPYDKLAESLSAADLHLVTLRDGLQGLLVPSKLYGILAAGRPVFYLGPERSELAQVVAAHKVGWQGRPGDAAGLAAAIEAAVDNPQQTAAQSLCARQLFDKRYDRPIATGRWRQLLVSAARGYSA